MFLHSLVCWVLLLLIQHLFKGSIGSAGDVIDDSSTLQFVHLLWRHGDRTPSTGTFPTDTKNGVSTWPEGWGELTKEGMRQHYALGQYLRKRYVDTGFLSKDYNASEIYVRSTSYNRTIMSALANLAGMYPPTEAQRWMADMPWQPIPVHSLPKEDDPLLWPDAPCPTFNYTYFEIALKSDAARKIEQENADFIAFLRNATGTPIMTLEDIWRIYDPLNCERIHGHQMLPWVTEDVLEKIISLNNEATTFFVQEFEQQRLRGGLLFGEIASRMEAKSKNSDVLQPNSLKYYAYSAHDGTLIMLLGNLGVHDGRNPPYASAVIIELHNISGKFIVKAFYVNETGSRTPARLIIEGCGATDADPFCTLDAFAAMAREHTPSDWYAECGIMSPKERKIKIMTIIAIVLGVLVAVLVVVVVVLVRRLRRVSRLM